MGKAEDILKKYKQTSRTEALEKNEETNRAKKLLEDAKRNSSSYVQPKAASVATKPTISTPKVNPVVQKIVNDTKKPLPLPGQNTKAATFTPLPVFTQNKTNNTIDTSKYGFTVTDNGTIKKGVQPSTTPTNIQTTLQQTPEKLTEEKKAELKKERNEIRDQIGVLRFVPDSGVDYLKNKVPSAAHLWDDRVKYGEKQNAYLQYSRELKQQQDAEHIANIIVKAKTDPQYTALSIPKAEGHKKDLYAFINNINNYQNAVRASNSLNIDNSAKESEAGAWTKYIYMTDDEKGIYNYLYAKEGEKSADSFLDAIANTLNQRVGKAVVEDFENKNSVYKATTAAGIALRSGVDQFGTGIKQLVKDDAVETSPIQYAGQEVRDNLSGAGAVAYDFLQTTANMAPSILVSVATNGLLSGLSAGGAIASAVGSATMGASAAGNAYKEMRENGYDVGEARVYGLMIGASEATLEHLLGGIKALGGKKGLGSVLAKNLGAVDNAYKRIAIDIGKQALSEASEEALQEIIDPILASVVLSDTYSPAEIENIMYSALLGALSGGVFESAGSVSNAMASQTAGNQIIKDGKTNDVITAGINTDTETESRALAEQLRERQEKGKKISPYQLGELKRQTDFATAQEKASLEEVQTPKPKMGSNGQRGFAETYVGDTVKTIAPKDATARYKAVYNATIENRAMTEAEAQAAAKIPDTMVRAAESAARADAVAETPQQVYNENTNEQEGINYGREGVHLRGSSQRADGSHTQGQIPAVEEDTRRDSSGDVQTLTRTEGENGAYAGEAPLTYGRKLTSAHIVGRDIGSRRDRNLRLVEDGENADTRAARKVAEERGLKLILFAGDNLHVKDEHGNEISARAYIRGKKMYIRADHPVYTAEQLAKHEAGHDRIDRGEIDVDAVREKLAGRTDEASRLYIEAYTAESDMTEQEIWAEVICDSLAGMNIFAQTDSAGVAESFLGDVRQATSKTARESKQTMEQVASTGKASIETLPDGKKYVKADRQVIFGNDPESWGEQVEDYINGKIRRGENVQLIAEDGDVLTLTSDTAGKASYRYKRDKSLMSDEEYLTKINAETHIDELAKISKNTNQWRPDEGSVHGDMAVNGWNYRTAFFKDFDGEYYRLRISVALGKGGNTVYNIGDIEKRSFPKVNGSSDNNTGALSGKASLDGLKISQDEKKVKDKFLPQNNNMQKEAEISRGKSDNGHASREIDTLEFLRRENEDLKLKLHEARRQVKRTERPTARLGDAYRAAQKLKARYDVDIEKEDLGKKIHELANYVIQGEELTFDELKRRARRIASEMVENAVVQNSTMYDEYKDLRDYVRDTKFAISEEDSHNIADFSAFKKSNFGRMPKLGIGQTNIDSIYREMQEQWPEFFSEEEIHHPADQLMHIVQVLDGLRITYDNPYSYNKAQAAEYIANDIVDTVLSEEIRQNKPTFADKQVARRAATIQQVIEKERNKRREKEEKMRKEFTEREDKMKSRWGARDMMRSIERHANKLTSALLRPNDKNHIPEDLRGVVATALYALNRESVYETYLDPETNKRKKVKIGKAEWFTNETSPMKKTIEAQEKRKEIAELDARKRLLKKIMAEAGLESSAEEISFKDAVRKLKDVYSEMDKDAEKKQQVLIAPELLDMLAKLEELSDTPIGAMDKDQLGVVWEAIRMIEASIANADKMFSKGRFAEISKAAGQMRADNLGKHTPGSFLVEKTKTAMLNLLDAQRYLHMLGHAGDALFRGLEAAQGKHNLIKKEISEFARELTKDIDVRALEREKNTVILGHQERTISTAQLMELYILMKRPAARRHILKGGIKIDAIPGIKGKIAQHYKTIKVNKTEIEQAITQFIREHKDLKEIADKMQRFAADNLGAYGNEASLEVFGYKKFKDADYWPIRAEHWEDLEAKARQTKVSNMGHSKQLENSISELYIGSAFETFARHSEAQAMYAAYLGIEQDIERIKNFSFWEAVDGEESERVKTGTVKEIINKVHGPEGVNFIVKQMQDIQSMAAGEQDLFSKMTKGMIGKNKAAAIGTNIRVMAQQWTAYFRNASVMSPKYLAQVGNVKKGWEEAKKHAPIAWQKAIGYSTAKDLMFDTGGVLDTIAEWSMKGAAAVDAVQFGALWNACKAETKAKHKDLKYGSDEFYDVVVKRFTDIVNQTQVVDGVLQRPQIMRSQNALNQMASAFMSEPLKQFNMFTGAVYDVMHAQTKEQKTKAAKQLTRTTTALLVSGVINSMAQSLVDALRDDEEKEEKFMKRWIDAFIGFTGDEKGLSGNTKEFAKSNIGSMLNPLGYIPYAKDITSVAMGYDISRMDMDVVNKLWRAGMDLTTAISGEGKKTIESALINAIAEGARFFGISASNLRRDIKAIVMSVAIQTDNYLFQYGLEKSEKNMLHKQNGKVFLDILYNAYKNDKEAYEVIYKDLLNSGMESDTIRKGMESRQKKDEGVTKVDELKQQRYLPPEQEKQFNSKIKPVKQSQAWQKATTAQRKYAEDLLYDIVTMTGSYKEYKRVIESSTGVNITEDEWLQYKLGLKVVDQKNDNGKLGTYTAQEKKAALDMIPELTRKEKEYLKNPSNK